MSDQVPGSGQPSEEPGGAKGPNPWSRESSSASPDPRIPDGPAPGAPGGPVEPPPSAQAPYPQPPTYPTPGYEQPPAYGQQVPGYDQGYGAPEQTSYGVPGYGVSPYPGGYGGMVPGYGAPSVQHPQATPALITGIIALVTGTLFGVGGLVGIAAIVLGVKARREIDSDPSRYEGRGKATAGLVLGVVGLAALVVWVLLLVALVALTAA